MVWGFCWRILGWGSGDRWVVTRGAVPSDVLECQRPHPHDTSPHTPSPRAYTLHRQIPTSAIPDMMNPSWSLALLGDAKRSLPALETFLKRPRAKLGTCRRPALTSPHTPLRPGHDHTRSPPSTLFLLRLFP